MRPVRNHYPTVPCSHRLDDIPFRPVQASACFLEAHGNRVLLASTTSDRLRLGLRL